MRRVVLLLALLCNSLPVLAQEPAPPPPAPPSSEPAPQPSTATPAGDTGMAGQVASGALGTGLGVLVPGLLLGVIGAAALVGVGNTDNTTPSSTATGTR